MGKLHLIMPMGGSGSRFNEVGYTQPKPMIEISGKPFFYWAAMSVLKYIDVESLRFVVLKKHVEQFGINEVIKYFFPDAIITVIPEVLSGPVLTCMEGCKGIEDNLPVLFNDCDHMFGSKALYSAINAKEIDCDGGLLTFESDEPQFSYVCYRGKEIVGTVEKKVVSSDAICGAYLFRNTDLFHTAVKQYLVECEYSEYFVSGVYNTMYSMGKKLKTYPLDFHVEFGTPSEYERAKDSVLFSDMGKESNDAFY